MPRMSSTADRVDQVAACLYRKVPAVLESCPIHAGTVSAPENLGYGILNSHKHVDGRPGAPGVFLGGF
jgi:hypothetical protein